MKKFFEEYGAVAIIVIVIAVLLLIVGSVKGLDETTGKVNGSGVASMVGNKLSESITKFQKSFMGVGVAKGPNGETLISKEESQVGKYADIDGDGTVDGIIFADLMVGGSGQLGNSDGKYTIPTISSCKDYYVSQESYADKLGGIADVLAPTGSGNDRFYIMALSDVSSNRYTWYAGARGIGNFESVASPDFGKGKSNTLTMVDCWNDERYGPKETGVYTDIWSEIQTQANKGWFVPSNKEWAAFNKQLGITDSNYTNKGLNDCYWSSSLYSYNQPFVAISGSCISALGFRYTFFARLAATF